jgi:CubicO group peptidase (beta-lactamase class C family)
MSILEIHFMKCVRAAGLVAVLMVLVFGGATARAQNKIKVDGDYAGTLGPLHLKLHLKADATGTITGTLDSIDQGAVGIPCADFHLDGLNFSFAVPAVSGSYAGSFSADGNTLAGTWKQGQSLPLSFTRDTFVPAAKPSAVDGVWLGALALGGSSLRIQIVVKSDAAGKEFCTLDSLDQRAMGNECDQVKFNAPNFSFDVPSMHGHWEGKLTNEKNLTGTWSQGSPMTLNFARQLTALMAAPIPPPTYDAAMPPVSAAELQSVLDKDLAEALASGQLAPGTGAGVSIGVVEHGVRKVFSYGTAKPDSIFEIGSITKTFTALILSQLVEQGKVHFDDPVRTLLPAGTVEKPAGEEITLLDLATQHSGLPRLPTNMSPADPANPYADYDAAKLYAFLAKQGVGRPAKTEFLYSNLGFGLLGQALAVHAGLTYPELLKQQVTAPLGLKDTVVSLTAEHQARFIQGHNPAHRPVPAWDLGALQGAGAIRSTASDMLTYVEANLHPEKLPAGNAGPGSTLRSALEQQHVLRADAMPGTKIALAWLFEEETGNYWHNGGTGGFTSYAFFNPKGDYAAVVLLNTTLGSTGSFADRLGTHMSQRLAGKPAISLAK